MKLLIVALVALIVPTLAKASNVTCTGVYYEGSDRKDKLTDQGITFDLDNAAVSEPGKEEIGKFQHEAIKKVTLISSNYIEVRAYRSVNADKAIVLELRKRNQSRETMRSAGVDHVTMVLNQGSKPVAIEFEDQSATIPEITLTLNCKDVK